MFTDGPGRIVLSTRRAVAAELRAMFVAAPLAGDSTTVIRRMRDEEAAAEDERWQRLQGTRDSDPAA